MKANKSIIDTSDRPISFFFETNIFNFFHRYFKFAYLYFNKAFW